MTHRIDDRAAPELAVETVTLIDSMADDRPAAPVVLATLIDTTGSDANEQWRATSRAVRSQ